MPIGCARAAMMGAAGLSVGPSELYLYNEGAGADDWSFIKISDRGTNSGSKEDGYLYLTLLHVDGGWAEIAFATNNKVDLTGYSKLKVDWECDHPFSVGFSVDAVQNTLMNSSAAYASMYEPFARRTDELDLTGLSGSYYVRLHNAGYFMSDTAHLKVYKVWLE